MRTRTLGGVVLGALLLLPHLAFAQTGTLEGVVTNSETGEPLFAANVQVMSQTDPSVRTGRLTDLSGRFEVKDLADGLYEIRVSYVGYETMVQSGIGVGAGRTQTVSFALIEDPIALETVVISASRRKEKALDAPAAVSVVRGEDVQAKSTLNVADHLQGQPGVDVQRAGVNQGTLVVRGFNNIFSGATLTLVDNRIARVPALRYNALNLIPVENVDIEQIELVSGPGSALYGPNTANGVLHILTRSPFDSEGGTISLGAGNRDILRGSGRYARALSEKVAFKISGEAYSAEDFEYRDPVEESRRAAFLMANPNGMTNIGNRDFDTDKVAVRGQLDLRPKDNTQLIFNGGWNRVNAIELTGLGAVQAVDFASGFGQSRLQLGDFFLQGYMNFSDAGDTYNLRTGEDFIDQSRFYVAQAQHQASIRDDKQRFIYGIDAMFTRPDTKGTINGRNEDDDGIDEFGGYLQSETELSDKLSLTLAARLDTHNKIDDPVFSPRAALVYGPKPGQKFRVTYNRAYSTPSTNNLFLDLVTAQDLGDLGATVGGAIMADVDGFDLFAKGVPEDGFLFRRDSMGGLDGLYMQIPEALHVLQTAPGTPVGDFVPADAEQAWNAVMQLLIAQGALPGALPAPNGAVNTVLRTLNPTTQQFEQIQASQVQDVPQIQPTITNTFEVGYKGILGDRVVGTIDAYYTKIEDFVGPLRVETPNVFFDPTTLAAYLANPGFGLSMQQVQDLTTAIAGIPVGTVTPSNSNDSGDLILTYRNFGEVDLTGIDLGLQFNFNDYWSTYLTYSWVSDDLFENLDGVGDIALNAPTNKASAMLRYGDEEVGLDTGVRVRYTDGFPVNSGVFVGEVNSYSLLDLDATWRLPGLENTSLGLDVLNVLDHQHREFVGVPELGRVAIFRLNQTFH